MPSTRPIVGRSPLALRTLVWTPVEVGDVAAYAYMAGTDIGANPSAEEADEGVDESSQTVIDVVHSFRLNETSFDKKSYLSHLKSTSIPQAGIQGEENLTMNQPT